MKIVCLGDSLTEGYGSNMADNWPKILADLTSHEIINQGISGDTTSGMLMRLLVDVLRVKPDMVVILGGTNDMICGVSYENVVANIISMTRILKKYNVDVLIGLPLKTYEKDVIKSELFITGNCLNSHVDVLRDKLRCLVFEDHQRFVDFNVLEEWDYLEDGIHPTPSGHEKMAKEVQKNIEKKGA